MWLKSFALFKKDQQVLQNMLTAIYINEMLNIGNADVTIIWNVRMSRILFNEFYNNIKYVIEVFCTFQERPTSFAKCVNCYLYKWNAEYCNHPKWSAQNVAMSHTIWIKYLNKCQSSDFNSILGGQQHTTIVIWEFVEHRQCFEYNADSSVLYWMDFVVHFCRLGLSNEIAPQLSHAPKMSI